MWWPSNSSTIAVISSISFSKRFISSKASFLLPIITDPPTLTSPSKYRFLPTFKLPLTLITFTSTCISFPSRLTRTCPSTYRFACDIFAAISPPVALLSGDLRKVSSWQIGNPYSSRSLSCQDSSFSFVLPSSSFFSSSSECTAETRKIFVVDALKKRTIAKKKKTTTKQERLRIIIDVLPLRAREKSVGEERNNNAASARCLKGDEQKTNAKCARRDFARVEVPPGGGLEEKKNLRPSLFRPRLRRTHDRKQKRSKNVRRK